MNLFKISWANLKSKPLNTFLSVLLLAFGIGLISLLMLVQSQLNTKFENNIKDIHMVLGAKGSPLQLILSAVYQIDAPTGNISYKEAKRIMKNPMIEEAIPLAYGDNYKKYRIVGTNIKYPKHYSATLAEGNFWDQSFEVTIGSKVARETGLSIGDTFFSAHGLDYEGEVHDEYSFKVVGILAPNGSVLDQLILTSISSIWEVHNHDHDHGHDTHSKVEEAEHLHDHNHSGEHAEHNHDNEDHSGHDHAEHETCNHGSHAHSQEIDEDSQDITAVLLKTRGSMGVVMLPQQLRKSNMQLAVTSIEYNRLTANFGIGLKALSIIGIIVVIISFISVFISLYNSLKERKYELALIRTMGGSRTSLFSLILYEGLIIATIGFISGILLSRIGLFVLSHYMEDNFQYSINNLGWTWGETILLVITILVGILASLLPAYQAIKIDISKTLTDG